MKVHPPPGEVGRVAAEGAVGDGRVRIPPEKQTATIYVSMIVADDAVIGLRIPVFVVDSTATFRSGIITDGAMADHT